MKNLIFLFLINLHSIFSQGSVMMVGGGGENYNAWSDEPYGWFVEKAGYGKIINIDVDESSDWYPSYFVSLGANITSHNLHRQYLNEGSRYDQLASCLEDHAILISRRKHHKKKQV